MPVLPLVASTTVWPGFRVPFLLGVFDDAEGEPVLDRSHRIEGLDLDEEVDPFGGQLVDANDRRVADRTEDAVVLGHDFSLWLSIHCNIIETASHF